VETGPLVEEIEAGVVEFRDEDAALVDHFLGVSAALIELLGTTPSPGDVSRSMNRLLRLFAAPDRARGTELGVWGELLVMCSSSDPVALVDAWHVSIDDQFDFSAPGYRLEVKTTTRGQRIHHFGLRQLIANEGVQIHVVSLMTTETDLGSSVADLVEDLRWRLASVPDRQMKVLEKVAETLGVGWPDTSGRRFDKEAAVESFRLFRATDIPRVEPGPPEVLEVQITSDVSDIAWLGRGDVDEAGSLVQSLGWT
jgi:hypothetical protein